MMDDGEFYVCPACGFEAHSDKFGQFCPACEIDLDEYENPESCEPFTP